MIRKNSWNYVFALFMLLLFCCDAMASMTFREALEARALVEGIDVLINHSVLAIVVEVTKVEETDIVRDSGYFEQGDVGDYIKTKETKILAYCNVKSVVKNDAGIDLSKDDKIVATFWEKIELARTYKNDWQIPLTEGESLFIFLEDGIQKTEQGIEYLPTFVRSPELLNPSKVKKQFK